MKKLLFGLLLFCSCASAGKIVKTGLDAAQIACVVASTLTDEAAILDACKIEKELAPVVRELVSSRAMACKPVLLDGGRD